MKTRAKLAFAAFGLVWVVSLISAFMVGNSQSEHSARIVREQVTVEVPVETDMFDQEGFPCFEDEYLGYWPTDPNRVQCIHIDALADSDE